MTCPCTERPNGVNPDPHPCLWVLPWECAALVIRPIQTIHTWRKRGRISSRRDPETGEWQVCNCEGATQAASTYEKWRRSMDRSLA